MASNEDTLQELIRGLGKHGAKPALLSYRQDGRDTWSYADFSAAVFSLAAGLEEVLEGDGKIVALFAGNSPEWTVTAMAAIYAGCVLLPVDRQADSATLEHIFNDSEARIVFTTEDLADHIRRLDLDNPPKVYFLDRDEGGQSWRGLMREQPGEPAPVQPGDRATLFYTSGTTGKPKGVPLTHANLIRQPEAIRESRLIAPDDRVLLPLPLHHVYPFVIGLLTPLALGLPVIFPASLTGREIIRAVADGRASIIIGVPRLYRTVYDGISNRIEERSRIGGLLFASLLAGSSGLRQKTGILAGRRLFPFIHRQFGDSLRVLASGGSALDPGLARKLEGLGWEIAVGYGLTETSPLLTINPPGSGKLDSVGRAVKGVEIKIAPAETSSRKQVDRETGEVLVRGPNVFQGYHGLKEKTEEAFVDGWFRTGDLGRLDGDGFLYLSGRAKTLIVTESGENLQPDEIEEAYAGQPAVAEIGIFMEDNRLKGIIVPDVRKIQQDGDIEEAIRKAVAGQSGKMASYKSLDDYVITREALPRTRLGKIRRHLLAGLYDKAEAAGREDREDAGPIPYAEMSDRDQALLENANAEKVWKWLAKKYSDRRLTPDSNPRFDLGIDSLEWLDFSLEIQQRTGIELDEEAIGRIDTIRDLLEEVSGRAGKEGSSDPRRPVQEPDSVLDADQKRWLESHGPFLEKLSLAAYHINRFFMRKLFGLQVAGLENLSGDEQYLITPNHLSVLDPMAIAAALPYAVLRRTYFAGWTGIAFSNVFFRLVSRLAHAVPVDSRHAVSSSLAFGSAVLGQGANLIWFPEGRRSPDGSLQEFKMGVSLLVEEHSVQVIPVFISGTFEAMPTGRRLPRFRKIRLNFGSPVAPETLRLETSEGDVREQIRHNLRQKVAELQNNSGDGGQG
jgi:long-chain acyl-CoA synthetase